MKRTINVVNSAKILGVCPMAVGNYIRSGRLPAVRGEDGRAWELRPADVRAFRKHVRPVGRPPCRRKVAQ